MLVPQINFVPDIKTGYAAGIEMSLQDWQNCVRLMTRLATERGICYALALENLPEMISAGTKYTVYLHKDDYFPEGEECVVGDNGDLITLHFKHQIVIEDGQNFQR
jgi:hypothetical protein